MKVCAPVTFHNRAAKLPNFSSKIFFFFKF